MASTRRRTNDGKKKTKANSNDRPVVVMTPPPAPSRQPRPMRPAHAAPMPTRVPARSAAKAKAVFKNFSLSKFAAGERAHNYVAPGQHPKAAQAQVITTHLTQAVAPNRALTMAMPPALLKKLLPSYNPQTGTVSVDDVVNALEQKMRGTEFYSNGDPTLNRLDIESQVQDIIQNVIDGAKR